MIAFLVGIIEEKREDSLTVDVNGIGFDLSISKSTFLSLPERGETVKVLTHMTVREDDVSLYGFSTFEEKNLFLKLIEVSGVGPKLALSILSGMPLSDLIISIIKEDVRALSSIKGLGKKTAERLCLELKDKLSPSQNINEISMQKFEYDEDALNLAIETLISLGINKNEAYLLAKSNAGPNTSAEEIISKSLRSYRS